MAGHSKWANIKHRKAAQDAKRGKLFTKLIRELTVAAKMGGPEVADNPRLRAAVDNALGMNMTKDTIERAIARGAGANESDNMEESTYEGYGTGGIAVLVEVMTDNKNRTVAAVRHAFSKCGGNLGTDGSVAYLFNRVGVLHYSAESDEEQVMDAALEAGAEDIKSHEDGSFDVITPFTAYFEIKDALEKQDLMPESAQITQLADNLISLDVEQAEKAMRLLDMLEDLDDVQNVYSNAQIDDDVLEQLEQS